MLSVHLVLSERSRGLVDAQALGWMKPEALLVNTARGPIVDEAALIDALQNGRLGGAALDVFAEEPLPEDSALWDVTRLMISPHMSGDTIGWRDDLAEQFLDNFDRWEAGEPLMNVVDKNLGYVPST